MASKPTPTLTLPHSTFAKVAPNSYFSAHLTSTSASGEPIRPNGRHLNQFRQPAVNTGSLSHCAGSAVVRSGDTAVVCGIQAEILTASSIPDPPRARADNISSKGNKHMDAADLAQLNLLVPNVELATGCSPAYLPGGGGPPSKEAQAISQRVLALLLASRIVELDELRIQYTPPSNDPTADAQSEDRAVEDANVPEVKAYWTLYISVHVLSLSGSSSLFDVVWASVMAALGDVKLPRAWWDPDLDGVICSDLVSEARGLNIVQRPFACTWGVVEVEHAGIMQQQQAGAQDSESKMIHFGDGRKAWLVADPDSFEDVQCLESVTIVLDGTRAKNPRIMKVEKLGGIALDAETIRNLVVDSLERWKEWSAVMA